MKIEQKSVIERKSAKKRSPKPIFIEFGSIFASPGERQERQERQEAQKNGKKRSKKKHKKRMRKKHG